jgi:uncharacterized protein (TIGR03435 family)
VVDVSPAPQFDVVSIKPAPPDVTNWKVQFDPGTMSIQNRSVFQILKYAYDLKSDSQLLSLPEWAKTEHFDIQGKEDEDLAKHLEALPTPQYVALCKQLVREVLKDRFHLAVHSTSIEAPIFSLTVAKSGAKVKPYMATDGKTFRGFLGPNGKLEARGASMHFLADRISAMPEAGGRVVVDNTGMTGEYSWTLRWTPERLGPAQATGGDTSADSADDAPTLFTALEEQLGLKLSRQKGSISALVVDQIERPTAN